MSSTATPPPTPNDKGKAKESPRATAMVVIGMAGSGKTTFMQRVNSYLHSQNQPPYVLNLDPAVIHLPFEANIDIRDTVDYAEVMKQYNLGPNGGIMTALNLFTTKFDQVLGHVEKRANEVDYVLLDTPGQIEIFTWSASGSIITDALASALPTVVVYIIDTPRTTAPATFMSNMLYACSILYKTRLPFLLVFNKTDVQSHEFALEWMRDFEAFQDALLERRKTHGEEDGPAYMDSLMNSMSLVLDEFYKHLRAVGVSAMTGEGMEELFDAVREAREEYETDYKPELEKIIAERVRLPPPQSSLSNALTLSESLLSQERKKEAQKADSISRLMKDMKVSPSSSAATGTGGGPSSAVPPQSDLENYLDPNSRSATGEGAEEDDEEDDDDDGEVIDRSARTDYYELPERRRGTGPGGAVEGEDGTLWPAP
ncbi:XPA-binding protein 1 [Rhodotorula sp. JG-1b]|nr:XPA-binding protein 1 [Rhodotorula sp. JG-1b]